MKTTKIVIKNLFGIREADRLREELADQAQVYKAKLTSAEVDADRARAAMMEAQEAQKQAEINARRIQSELSAATTERMQTLEKQLAQADPDTATFKVLFTSWQETYGKMMEALERIRAADSDKAGKLQGAIQAVVEGMA